MTLRMRGIRPGFFLNEQLADCSPHARLLFVGLWMLADREGRLEDRPRRIHAAIFPYEHDVDVDAMLCTLTAAGFIERYEVDGARYIEVPGLTRNQHINQHEPPSELPPNPAHVHAHASTDMHVPLNAPSARAGTEATEGMHVHASLNGMERNGKEKKENRAHAREGSLSLLKDREAEAEAEPDPADLQDLHQAFADALGTEPKSHGDVRKWRDGVRELAALEVRARDAPHLVDQYRAKFGDGIPCHPKAIADNYGSLTGQSNGHIRAVQRLAEAKRERDGEALRGELARLGVNGASTTHAGREGGDSGSGGTALPGTGDAAAQ